MAAVPALVAGVRRIAVVTPNPVDATLVVARELGLDEVYAVGGAQAVAALAYGTDDDRAGRPHRRPGERLRHRREAARLEPRRDRPPRRAERGDRDRRRDRRRRRRARPTSSPRPSTGRERGAPPQHRSRAVRRASLRLLLDMTTSRWRRLLRWLRRWRARRRSPPSTSSSTSPIPRRCSPGSQRRLGVRRRLGRHRRLRGRRDARPADRRPRALLRRPRPRDVHEAAAGRAGDAPRRRRRGARDRPDRARRGAAAPRGRRRAPAGARA